MSRARTRLVLATDLDGTLAYGDPAVRARLISWLQAQGGAALVYVTGRTPRAAAELAERVGLPEPDVLIADVGTSVLRGLGPRHIDEIEARIGERWPGGDVVRTRLAGVAELALQDVEAPRRVSYWIEAVRGLRPRSDDPFVAPGPQGPEFAADAARRAGAAGERAARALAGLEVDVLVSANLFLDVLPRGVDKGSTLRRVLRWLGTGEEACVVAGDSLNDLALFELGCRGIVVGNCEPALRQRVGGMGHVYVARESGVAGVLEGLRHHGLAPDAFDLGGARGG